MLCAFMCLPTLPINLSDTEWYWLNAAVLYSNFLSSRSLRVSQAPGLFPSSAAILPTSESAPLPSRKAWLDTMYMAHWQRVSMTLVRRMLDRNPSALDRTMEIIMRWSSFPSSACQYISDSWTHARCACVQGYYNTDLETSRHWSTCPSS